MILKRLSSLFLMPPRPHWPRAFRQAERAGPTWGPLSLYPQIDKGRFIAISALIALPSRYFGNYRYTLWSIWADLLRFRLLSLHPFGNFGAYRPTLWSIWSDLLPFRPLSLYPLAISALSYVPFVSVPCWAPCCRTLYKFSSPASSTLGLGGVSSWLTPRGLGFVL